MVNKRRIYWTLQIGGWLLYATLQTVVSVFAFPNQVLSVNRVILFLGEAFLFMMVTHGFRYLLIHLRWLDLGLRKLIFRILVSVVVLGFVVYFLRIPVNMLGGVVASHEVFDAGQILGLSFINALILFLWTLLYFTYHYIEQYNKSLKVQALAASIELSNLKSQLNPHFIFNALNSIRALVDENPLKSKEAINQLSNILRNSLTFDKKELTKFDDELKMVVDYLGLESIRFEERLKTSFDIHPESNGFLVPPFMIQTLVENGIKHGISKRTDGGWIQIKTSVSNNKLIVKIRNSGHYVNGSRRGETGVGVANTIQRLKLLYGSSASFRILNEKDNFVLTEVIIPQIS